MIKRNEECIKYEEGEEDEEKKKLLPSGLMVISSFWMVFLVSDGPRVNDLLQSPKT